MKRCEKAGFLSPGSSKIIVTKEGKERVRRRKEGQQRKAMVALLVFIIATLKIVFGLTWSFKDWFSKKNKLILLTGNLKLFTIKSHSKSD